jgi:peptide chain release factor 1
LYDKAQDDTFTLDPSDVKVETMKSSGPGGQHVNSKPFLDLRAMTQSAAATDSKVKLTHLPTGQIVAVQSERSQHQNRRKAFEILESRLLNLKLDEEAQMHAQTRRKLLVDRRIRTYEYYRVSSAFECYFCTHAGSRIKW